MDSDEAYSEHLQQERICTKVAEPTDDRIRPHFLKRLDFKKAPYSNARNIEEKWRMLFKVLFPADTTIPSPCRLELCTLDSIQSLMRTDEQSGMSPQLERALCEALEEELTRELALVIEPIMTRIKGCIPAIIERCREKLRNSASSSDDEVVLTPQSSPPASVASSRQGGCASASKQGSPSNSFLTYPGCESSSPNPPYAHSMGQAVQENAAEPETFCVSSLNDAQFTFAEQSMADCDKRALDHCGGLYQCSQDDLDAVGVNNIPGLGHGIWDLASSATQSEDHCNPPGIGKTASASSDQCTYLEPWRLGKGAAHPITSSLPDLQTYSLEGRAGCTQDIESDADVSDPQNWKFFLRNLDTSDDRF